MQIIFHKLAKELQHFRSVREPRKEHSDDFYILDS